MSSVISIEVVIYSVLKRLLIVVNGIYVYSFSYFYKLVRIFGTRSILVSIE